MYDSSVTQKLKVNIELMSFHKQRRNSGYIMLLIVNVALDQPFNAALT